MTNEFDAERARAGEPIQFCLTNGTWVDVRYVGRCPTGHVIYRDDGGLLITQALRMKPPSRWAVLFPSEDHAMRAIGALDDHTCGPMRLIALPPEETP